MSRSGYTDDYEFGYLFSKAVERALQGRRGQAFLREMVAALDAMPDKRLIQHALICEEGLVCALGAVAQARGLDVSNLDDHDPEEIAAAFGLARTMVQEIAYQNDEWSSEVGRVRTDEERWQYMRDWAAKQIWEWSDTP